MTSQFINLAIVVAFLWAAVYAKAETKTQQRIQKLIEKDIKISNQIDKIANDIDDAFSGKDTSASTNPTKLIIRNQLNWGEGGEFTYQPHLDLQLRLPNLEKKWKLKFTTIDEDQEKGINRDRVKTTPSRRSYGGGVGLAQTWGNVNTEFQPRVEYRDGVQLSYLLKFSQTATTKFLVFRPEVQFFGRSDSGLGEFVGANIDIPIYKSLTATLINEEEYQDNANILSTNNGLSFGWTYSDVVSHGVSLIYEGSSRPSYHLDRYTVAMGLTHKVFPNILQYTVTPYLAFPRNLDFKGSPGIGFVLDLIF